MSSVTLSHRRSFSLQDFLRIIHSYGKQTRVRMVIFFVLFTRLSFAAECLPSPSDSLTPFERQALQWYTGGGHISLNPALRNSDPLVMQEPRALPALLKSALTKLPNYEGYVYRCMRPYQGYEGEYAEGTRVSPKGFTSTSKNASKTKIFGSVCFQIRSKYGKDISAFSKVPEEEEVLFLPESEFQITYFASSSGLMEEVTCTPPKID